MALNTKKKIIARNAPAGIVMTQETKIRLTTRRSIASMTYGMAHVAVANDLRVLSLR